MKARIAALVLTGILCAAAPAWSDTICDRSADSAAVTIKDFGGADMHNAPSLVSLVSFFSSGSGKLSFFELEPTHRLWEGRGWQHEVGGDAPSSPSTPVTASEPGTLPMLALGLMGLLGSALIVSPSRSRRA
jgi:hypothetical protein